MAYRVNETECKFETECDLCLRAFDYEAMRSDCIETVMQEMGWHLVSLAECHIVQLCPDCVKAILKEDSLSMELVIGAIPITVTVPACVVKSFGEQRCRKFIRESIFEKICIEDLVFPDVAVKAKVGK